MIIGIKLINPTQNNNNNIYCEYIIHHQHSLYLLSKSQLIKMYMYWTTEHIKFTYSRNIRFGDETHLQRRQVMNLTAQLLYRVFWCNDAAEELQFGAPEVIWEPRECVFGHIDGGELHTLAQTIRQSSDAVAADI